MTNDDTKPTIGESTEAGTPLIHAARAQIAAARLRREALIASGNLTGLSADNPASLPAKDFPGYTLLREIHRGGQGVVYQAMQQSTNRKVAIKVLLEGSYASKAARQRFEREIELVASLRHPNVISVFHSDRTADGLRFCVMDYVRGLPLTRYARENHLNLHDALRLFATVCEAVNHAHLKGVIHRDLKPSNILVDIEGMPRVLDFGLAKMVGGAEQSLVSMTGQVVGTLPYMSPEQTRGNPDEIDTRTDVYALGVLLYEMLTGRYPYPIAGPMAEVLKHIAYTEPTPPSRAWTPESGVLGGKLRSGIGRFVVGSGFRLGRLHLRRSVVSPIDDEVQTIVLKALTKERERRYQSAGELARDIGHYLAGEPVEAKRDSALYVLGKQLRRYKAPVAVAGLFVIVVIVFGVVMSIQAQRNRHLAVSEGIARKEAVIARVEAERDRDRAKLTTGFLQTMLGSMNPERPAGRVDSLRGLLDDASGRVQAELAEQPEVEAAVRTTIGLTYQSLGLYREAEPHLHAAMEIRRRLLGEENPETLTAIHNWAVLLHYAGRTRELEPVYRRTLELRRRVLGEEHPDTMASLDKLAWLLEDQGRLTDAEALKRRALEVRVRVQGNDHPDTLASREYLGHLLMALGKYREAEDTYREVIDGRRRVLGEDHPMTGFAITRLASVFRVQGRLAEAEESCRAALAIERMALGDEHPEVSETLSELALILQNRAEYDGAESLMREALALQRKALGDEHPDTLMSISKLGYLLCSQGKHVEAETYWREALEKQRRVLGDEHPDTLISMGNIGYLLQSQGKLVEAEPYYREALEKQRRVLGDEHPDTLDSVNHMGLLLQAEGNLTEAELYRREDLEKSRRILGDEHPDTLISINNMGDLLQAQGKSAEAVALLALAEPAARRAFTGANDRRLGRFLTILGRSRTAIGTFAAAQTNLREAHAVMSKAVGVPLRHLADVLTGMVELYDAWHVADPSQGHDTEATEWRAKLDEFNLSSKPATP